MFSDDLLAQATQLASVDTLKPRQANLRRAVSAVYYSVFHALVHEACSVQMGSQPGQAAFRHVLGRAFVHGTMKQACAAFGGGTLKAAVTKGLPVPLVIPQEIRQLAELFAHLQEKRHSADYDLTERFCRADVLTLIDDAQCRLADFRALPMTDT